MSEWSKEAFASNLKYYMEKAGRNQKEMAEIVGVSAPTFNEWIKAKKFPRIDKIEILANYFGILKSDLIEQKAEHMPLYYRGTLEGVIGRDTDLMAMILKYLKLDDQKKKAVKQMIDTLSE